MVAVCTTKINTFKARIMSGGARILEWRDGENLPPIPNTNFAAFILEAVKSHGNNTAMINAQTKASLTFKTIASEVPRVAGGLKAGGVSVADPVLLITPTHLDYTTSLLSIVYLGAVCVPLSASMNAEELARAIKISGARFAIYHDSASASLQGAITLLPQGTLKGAWRLSRQGGPNPNLGDLLKGSPVSPYNLDGLGSKIPALMLFSSGTTGLPKGVLLSHTALLAPHAVNDYLIELIKESLGPDAPNITSLYARMLLLLPLHHIYGFHMCFFALKLGCLSVLLPRFSTKEFFKAIEEFKITACPLVPHLASFLANTSQDTYNLSSLVALSSSAAPLPSATVETLQEKRGITINNGYGMTEAVNIASSGGPIGFIPGAVGKIMPYAKVKIVDVNTGEMLGEGQEGEVCVKAPTVMLGYVNNPEATSTALDSSGWLHTGDIGYYDQEECLYLTDRMKDLIKVKGFQVSPKEVEDVIQGLKGVVEAAVVGVPDARTGEAVRAYVVLAPSANLTPNEIRQAVAEHLSAPHKHLTGGVEVIESLPRNATGKVLKKELKDRYIASRAKL